MSIKKKYIRARIRTLHAHTHHKQQNSLAKAGTPDSSCSRNRNLTEALTLWNISSRLQHPALIIICLLFETHVFWDPTSQQKKKFFFTNSPSFLHQHIIIYQIVFVGLLSVFLVQFSQFCFCKDLLSHKWPIVMFRKTGKNREERKQHTTGLRKKNQKPRLYGVKEMGESEQYIFVFIAAIWI